MWVLKSLRLDLLGLLLVSEVIWDSGEFAATIAMIFLATERTETWVIQRYGHLRVEFDIIDGS